MSNFLTQFETFAGSRVRLTFALTAVTLLAVVGGAQPPETLSDPALDARYQALIREVRCLVCQNQTIADSNADLASDLRREIREMLVDGASDGEIADFLVARYGDFVLYRPPLQPNTWALWGGPAAMVLIGLIVFARVMRSRSGQPLDDDELDEERGAMP